MEYDNIIRDIMMKKITLAALLLTTGFSAYAETETCKQYFAEVDSFIELASKQEGTKAQVDMLKTQHAESKKQMEALTAEQQDAGCKQGLEAMQQLKAAMNLK